MLGRTFQRVIVLVKHHFDDRNLLYPLIEYFFFYMEVFDRILALSLSILFFH